MGVELTMTRLYLFVLASTLMFLLLGCGGSATAEAAYPEAKQVTATAGAPMEAELEDSDGVADSADVAAPLLAQAAPDQSAPSPAPAPPSGAGQAEARVASSAKPMLDIEGNVAVEVKDVDQALIRTKAWVKANGGQLTREETSRQPHQLTASVTLRIPAEKTDAALDALDQLGHVTSRNIRAKDITREFLDASLRLRNLELTLARYEQMLQQATNMKDMLALEQQITRVRGEIERLKGSLRFMRDRAARATLHVSFSHPVESPPDIVVRPEAQFYPGLRLGLAQDVWRKAAPGSSDLTSVSMYSVGLSIAAGPQISVDVDALKAADTDAEGIDGVLATLGGKVYSEFLGAGHERWFEPYLAWRLGYARLNELDEAVVGAGVGLDIYKTEIITVGVDARFSALFLSKIGAHAVIQPAATISSAF